MYNFINNLGNFLLVGAGSFQPLLDKFNPFFDALKVFLQTISVSVAVGMAIWYKLREMFANQQEDQMFSQKSKNVFIALVFVFLVPTIVTILQGFFK